VQAVLADAQKGFGAIKPSMSNQAGGLGAYMDTLQLWLSSCLAGTERQVLAAVSVFPGSFTEAGAAAVTGVDDTQIGIHAKVCNRAASVALGCQTYRFQRMSSVKLSSSG